MLPIELSKEECGAMSVFFPPPDTIIYRNNSGGFMSRFCDGSWNLCTNDLPTKNGIIYFSDDLSSEAKQFVKYIIYLLMTKKTGHRLSARTLVNYSKVVFRLAAFTESRNENLFAVFSDLNLLGLFFHSITGWSKETAGSILNALSKMNADEIGFKVFDSKKIFEIKGVDNEYRAGLKQHSPLPTRIYSEILNKLSVKLDEWILIKDEVLFLSTHCFKNKLWGRSQDWKLYKKNRADLKSEYPTFDEVCSDSLKNYLKNSGNLCDIRGVSRLIGEVQLTAKLTIQAYTGMRDNEANTLPLYCEYKKSIKGKFFWAINGFSTKFNHGDAKPVFWVSNAEAVRAVKIAREISICIANAVEIKYDEETKNIPLFTSVAYLGNLAIKKGKLKTGVLTLATMQNFRKNIQPIIEIDDLKELRQIDLHRAWDVEPKFEVGKSWEFTSHQLRRSLALYAHKSGIVSLPSLRRQMQQITEAMANYYAKGSYFAVDFVSNKNNNFIYEWQDSVSVSSAISYIKNVLDSDEKLAGGHGSWVESRVKSNDVLFETSRENIVKMFKKGDIAYRETLIGGCTAVGGCHQPVVNWLNVDCLKNNCRNMICIPSNLKRVILAQKNLIAGLDVVSVEYKIEMAALQVMLEAYGQDLEE